VNNKLEQKIKRLLVSNKKTKAEQHFGGAFHDDYLLRENIPANQCTACASSSPPSFCSCIKAWYGGAWWERNDNTGDIRPINSPDGTVSEGYRRFMEWPASCPSMSQMTAPAFTNQAEWNAVKKSWVRRLARAMINPDPKVRNPALNIFEMRGGILFPMVSQCMLDIQQFGGNCGDDLFIWTDNEFQGLPTIPYWVKYLMDNGCVVGQEVPGACCSVAGDFGGFSCAEVGGSDQCLNGTFHPGKTCEQIGGDNCGKSKISVIAPSKRENTQLGTASITDMIIRALKGSV
jgi:hypothetical protein